ncbi:MAG: addiction module toxin RelE [Alphaproteobacteria bacterium]|nr:MAG: addiction module toxin RelE [Alphaproteobacteria bacterium]
MSWLVDIYSEFEVEFEELALSVKKELFAKVKLLEEFGPELKRPHADTLEGSKHSNMKELRFNADKGVWRVAFAFDPERQAILLVAGDKSGTNQKRFYKGLIKKADTRFDAHLEGE